MAVEKGAEVLAPHGQCGWFGSRLMVWVGVWQKPSLPPAIQDIAFWKLGCVLL